MRILYIITYFNGENWETDWMWERTTSEAKIKQEWMYRFGNNYKHNVIEGLLVKKIREARHRKDVTEFNKTFN